METERAGTVPLTADVVSSTKLLAGIVPLSNEVVESPVVVLVVVIPPVFTSVRPVVMFAPYLTENVTEGVAVPFGSTDSIFEIVHETVLKKITTLSADVGDSM